MLIVIEHLEPVISRWLLIEYKHAAEIAKGNLLITNVCGEEDINLLRQFASARCESASEIFRRPIILDPSSSVLLSPRDREIAEAFIIGGILGDHPPRGRTKELLTSKFRDPVTRSLGEGQYSIDGAVYVTYKVIFEGKQLSEIPYVDGLKISAKAGFLEHEIFLPFRYPLVNGKPLIHPDLLRYIKGRVTVEESRLIKGEE